MLKLWPVVVSAFCATFRPERPILKRDMCLTPDLLVAFGVRPAAVDEQVNGANHAGL
ncbi:hypothetical protein D3C86_1770970 [compost metagenome]